jgi:hypothetical protein
VNAESLLADMAGRKRKARISPPARIRRFIQKIRTIREIRREAMPDFILARHSCGKSCASDP